MDAATKFSDDLTIGDWSLVEEIVGVSMQDIDDASQLKVMVAFLVVAKRKTGETYNVSDANKLKLSELEQAYSAALSKLGYEDDGQTGH